MENKKIPFDKKPLEELTKEEVLLAWYLGKPVQAKTFSTAPGKQWVSLARFSDLNDFQTFRLAAEEPQFALKKKFLEILDMSYTSYNPEKSKTVKWLFERILQAESQDDDVGRVLFNALYHIFEFGKAQGRQEVLEKKGKPNHQSK